MLRAQAWDAETGEGVDVELDPSTLAAVEEEGDGREGLAVPVSVTERARLRSLLLAGMEKIEEWLEGLRISGGAPASSSANGNDTADANMNGIVEKEDESSVADAEPGSEADSVNETSNGDRNVNLDLESALEKAWDEKEYAQAEVMALEVRDTMRKWAFDETNGRGKQKGPEATRSGGKGEERGKTA